MNRSFSSSFKSNVSKTARKQIKKSGSSINFQTLYKTRDNHTLIKSMMGKSDKKQQKVEREHYSKQQIQQPLSRQNQNSMVNNKTFKNSVEANDSFDRKNLRDSGAFERQKTPNENIELIKSFSQPKLKSKNSAETANSDFAPTSLDQIQKKVMQLLELKLMKKTQNKFILSGRVNQDQFQKDLQDLIIQIQQFQSQKLNDNSNIEAQIKLMKQRIQILQKIIAQSFTQSEILKKYYYWKKFSRKPSCQNKLLRQTISGQSHAIKPPNFNYFYPSMHFSTIMQSSFGKPQKQAYQNERIFQNKFSINKQPLGKSTYQTEFLNYGCLPTYPIKNNSDVSVLGIKQKTNTIYQSDFKQKKIQLIDSKELSCRQDKFRPTKITFMPKKMLDFKQNQSQSHYKSHKKTLKHKVLFEGPKNTVQSYAKFYKQSSQLRNTEWSNQNQFKSQYKSKFSGESSIIQSLIKQSNLSNLKNEFRRNFNV